VKFINEVNIGLLVNKRLMWIIGLEMIVDLG
jgi:hypothetical protein